MLAAGIRPNAVELGSDLGAFGPRLPSAISIRRTAGAAAFLLLRLRPENETIAAHENSRCDPGPDCIDKAVPKDAARNRGKAFDRSSL